MARLLLDSCLWGGCLPELKALGHDVEWSGNWSHDPGDREILARAYQEQRILFTNDKDFGELIILKGEPHCGLVRLQGFKALELGLAIHTIASEYGELLGMGALIVATPRKIRIRKNQE